MRLTGFSAIGTGPARPAVAQTSERIASAEAARPVAGDKAVTVATSVGSEPNAPTVDADRVAEVRKAIAEDRYPLVPAKIADALIAAKLFGIVKA